MEETRNHKCLLYWHKKAMGNIPVPGKERMMLYPGYNAFDYEDLEGIYKECKDIIDLGIITFFNISIREADKGIKITESATLADLTIKELDSVLGETYNPATLDILSDTSVVNALYSKQATGRKKKLAEAVGTEADNIKEYKENATGSV